MGIAGRVVYKPNLVFVIVDQMRGMDMGCAGNPQVLTSNLDRLAKDGFLFHNAISCFPVCTPNRACLISGRYPTTTDVMNNDVPLPIDGKGFGHILKAAGYKTGWVGKWHLFGPDVRTTFIPPGEHRHGFDDLWAGINCSHQYFDSFYYLNDSPEKVPFKGYEPDIQTDIAMDFISKQKDHPFALFLSWGPPHDPYHQVPDQWKDLYNPEKIVFRNNVQTDIQFILCPPGNTPSTFDCRHFYNTYHEKPDGSGWTDTASDPRSFPDKHVIRDYYAAISALDHNMGRLLDRLEKLGLTQNTIVVFTSDHGDMMYSHRTIQKNYPWEESLNVPFILKYPDYVQAGRVTDKPFNTVDILPTILDLMELQIPDFSEGHSFAPTIKGEDQLCPEAAYIMCPWPWVIPAWRGIRTQRYTYVETHEGPFMLYDNLTDPYQLVNLLQHSEYQEVRNKLELTFKDMARKVNDPFETWEVIQKRMDRINEEWMRRYPFHNKQIK